MLHFFVFNAAGNCRSEEDRGAIEEMVVGIIEDDEMLYVYYRCDEYFSLIMR
jgi:hypothetical protein